MRLPDFISQRQPRLDWRVASFGVEGVGGGAQAATAHQRSNNTTDDRPRGKPRAASPSASMAANGSCSKGRSFRLECLGLAGVFLPWKPFSIQRALPGKEWN